jgi:cytochrome c553
MMKCCLGWLAIVTLAALLFPPKSAAQAAESDITLAQRIEMCGACHGRDGNAPDDKMPSLAGQPRVFIETQLIYFRERLRRSEEMTPQAQGLSDETIVALAEHYANLPIKPKVGPTDEDLLARGQELARAERCGTCHLPDYSGRQQMPRLAGQQEAYLVQAMKSYRNETRGGPDTTMIDIMRGLPDFDIRALAHFFSYAGRVRNAD